MTNEERLLSNSPLFEGASQTVLAHLLAKAQQVRFAAGEIPVAEATINRRILMVTEGEVQISAELQAGQDVKVLRVGAGTFVGLINFFAPVSQPHTVTALTDLRALAWDPEDWRRLCEADPAFGWRLSQRIGRELVERMSNWINELLNNVSWGM